MDMAKSPRIYRNEKIPHADIPNVDLLTLLFDHEQGVAQQDTVLHADAANPDNKFTKQTLQQTFQRIAHGLRHSYGVGASGPSRDVITVISYGQVLIPAVYLGVVCAGGIYSAASPSSTVAELARQIKVGTSNLIICGTEHIDVTTKAAKECGVPLSRILVVESNPTNSLTSLESGKSIISSTELPWQPITDLNKLKTTTITILWSSGTTGLPKGVSLSHLNLVAESVLINYQPRQFVMHQLETDPESYKPIEYKTLAHLPISHIAGLFGYMITATYNGGTVYWMRKYNWSDLLKYARQYAITAFYTVPSIYLRISKSPDVGDAFAHVEAASTGAAPMDGSLQTASNKRLGNGTDTFIGQTWGLSETTGAVTAPIRGETDITGCIGWILPDVELRMVDDDFQDVSPGEEGEMLIRSPLVMNGYFNNEQATREAFHDFNDDGRGPWFCTGDIGVQRDGKFYIVDRKKELLKYKGLQIAPAEIENLLFTHPAVAEAAVVGVPAPDDPGTEWPRAYVVLARDMHSSKQNMSHAQKVTSVQSYPVAPELNAKAAGLGDVSKQDTLSQTRYTDAKMPQERSGQTELQSYPVTPALNSKARSEKDGSQQDTLDQTRYEDRKVDQSKQDTIDQTRYEDGKGALHMHQRTGDGDLADELKKFVADRLAQHKQLRGGVKFVSELPKNAIGKFLRRELRQRAKQEVAEERGEVKAKL